MTVPAYHVGQILYHRASGERAIVVEVRPGVVQVSADVNRFVEFRLDGMPLVFSTEPVVVPSLTHKGPFMDTKDVLSEVRRILGEKLPADDRFIKPVIITEPIEPNGLLLYVLVLDRERCDTLATRHIISDHEAVLRVAEEASETLAREMRKRLAS